VLWDVASRSLIRRFVGHQHNVTQVIFSADGRRIFSAGGHRMDATRPGSVREWRVDRTLEELWA